MISQEFKNHTRRLSEALARQGVNLDVYALLNVADETFIAPVIAPDFSTHLGRVEAALANPQVMAYMVETKKISAIKELRAITGCGLKEAKDAVEDARVSEAVADRNVEILREKLAGDPWAAAPWVDEYDEDEPPF